MFEEKDLDTLFKNGFVVINIRDYQDVIEQNAFGIAKFGDALSDAVSDAAFLKRHNVTDDVYIRVRNYYWDNLTLVYTTTIAPEINVIMDEKGKVFVPSAAIDRYVSILNAGSSMYFFTKGPRLSKAICEHDVPLTFDGIIEAHNIKLRFTQISLATIEPLIVIKCSVVENKIRMMDIDNFVKSHGEIHPCGCTGNIAIAEDNIFFEKGKSVLEVFCDNCGAEWDIVIELKSATLSE